MFRLSNLSASSLLLEGSDHSNDKRFIRFGKQGHTEQEIKDAEFIINARPRKVLNLISLLEYMRVSLIAGL